jgi:hypothetical protein
LDPAIPTNWIFLEPKLFLLKGCFYALIPPFFSPASLFISENSILLLFFLSFSFFLKAIFFKTALQTPTDLFGQVQGRVYVLLLFPLLFFDFHLLKYFLKKNSFMNTYGFVWAGPGVVELTCSSTA